MKKNTIASKMIALTMAVGLLAFTGAYAQEQQASSESGLTAKFGIKGGFNLTSLYVDNVSSEHAKAGFNAGIFAKLPVTKGLSIQPELLYSVKGAKDTYSNFIQGDGEYRFNLNYIELPVLAVINVARNFNLHAGGYAAYLVSANVKDVNSNGDIDGASDLNADNFKRFDFGLAGGVGFDIDHVTLGARYNYGLTQIGKSGNLSGDLTKNSKNAGLSVYIGFAF
ncbi:MAG TPA: porin family protein [Puia sp.]|nr:porin family protein [Puia sp.]